MNGYGGNGDWASGSNSFNEMDTLIRAVVGKLATAALVRVIAVQGDTVTIRPMVSQITGDGTPTEHGDIHNVPYLKFRGGGNMVDIKPKVNDRGLAVFLSHDSSVAIRTDGDAVPGSRRRFDWADAIYVTGLARGEPENFVRIDDTGVLIKAPTIAVEGNLEVTGNTAINGNLSVSGMTTLGGPGATQFVMLASGTPSTTVKAL